jgi:hypothetical protein
MIRRFDVHQSVLGVWGIDVVPWTGLLVISLIRDEYLGGVTAVVNIDAAVVQSCAHDMGTFQKRTFLI